MRTDLAHHYKDREPKETIEIITEFFENNGYKIELFQEVDSVSGTYGYSVTLKYNGIPAGSANGKGMTKEYAYASALGELYERFCNNAYTFGNPLLLKVALESHKQKHGYYYNKEEKIVSSISDNLNQYMYDYFLEIAENDPILMENFLSYANNNKKVLIPFKNIFGNDTIYINPMALFYFQGTNGMVAGNTEEEAFNQGISELVERSGLHRLLDYNKNPILYQLNEDNFPDNLKQLVQNVKNDNNDFYIFDLSYSVGLPIILSILVNKVSKKISVNAGSFPVFEIALERIITETYQNTKSFQEYKGKLRIPFKENNNYNYFIRQTFDGPHQTLFPEKLLNNIKKVDYYNKEVFLSSSDNYNNSTILNYYKNLLEKNELNIYYYDNSYIPDMKAFYLYAPELSKEVSGFRGGYSNVISSSEMHAIKQDGLEFARELLYHLYNYLQTGIIDNFIFDSGDAYADDKLSAAINFYFFNQIPLYPIMKADYVYIYRIFHTILTGNLNKILPDNDIVNIAVNAGLYNFSELIKYCTLLRYVMCEKYSYEEIKEFFEYFSDEITLEDYNNVLDSRYLFTKTFLEPFKERYSIDKLKDLFKLFIEKE